ncbi:MAG: CoA-acylating methylmalonate-semialdehyde dehydrogenase [Phycisphaeraceae bacterium]|nr:MAG: CoA-acylating methylmalonate-semialdehyde dehydrogenase [Phycisphaeraceae bacterium]
MSATKHAATQNAAHLIAGRRIDGAGGAGGGQVRTNVDPASGAPTSAAPLESVREAEEAVQAAARAFETWSATPVGDRVQPLFRFKALLEQRAEELAAIVVREHGKTTAEAMGSVRRGIDCVEFACGAPGLMMGRTLPQIAVSTSFCRTEDQGGVGIDSSVDRLPLGVCVGITPFNFPVMVPLWMWPMAVACGNTFVLKPSEKDPTAALRVTELAHEAGLPPGVLNLVNGGPSVVDHLITHDRVAAVSFVGSTRAGEHIYKTSAGAGKRVQCMCGAKNHSIIMPDANRGAAIEGVTGSAFGNTGQRCLAGSVAVCVGDAAEWLVPGVVEAAKKIRIDRGDAPGCGMGPLIDAESKERVLKYIEFGIEDGATLALDGREADMPGEGNFVGPTVFDHCKPGMRVVEDEIFGPALSVMREETLDAAIATVNRSKYGNMAVIFTSSGHDARRFGAKVEAGMLGVNVGVPAPMAAFPFAGWKKSFYGDLHANGEDGVRFYTKQRVTVTRWL